MKHVSMSRLEIQNSMHSHVSFDITSMKEKPMQWICTLVMLSMVISSAPALSAPKKTQARYPSQLHGMWIPEAGTCPEVGQSYDGDMIMRISSRLLHGYEDQSKPTAVVLISKAPLAWRVESMMDVGPSGSYTRDMPRIFVLGKERVTVITEDHADTYKRCVRNNK